MKALVITPYYMPKVGGLEIFAQQLNIALRDLKKWDIVVATSNHNGRKTVVDTVDGITVYRLDTIFKLSNTPLNPFWPFMLRRLIKREHPDVILAHTPVPSMADAVALAHGRTPLFVFYHASTLMKGDAFVFNMVARAYQLYERFTLSQATRVFAVSDFVKAQFAPKLQAKTAIVPNAVWAKQITTREQPAGSNFLFIGSLERTHAWKGLELIIRAIATYKQTYKTPCTLTIMGDGNARQNYESLVQELGLQKEVHFLGNKTGDEKEAAFKDATALVMYPTTANDAFPTVMLEAWARSVPVISAAIGPIPSLLNDQVDGYLVAPHQPTALAETLHQVATSSLAERAKIAAAAAARTKAAYTWEQQAEAVASLVGE